MPAYDIQTYTFGNVQGIRQPQSEYIVSVEPKTPFATDSRKGTLSMLVETDPDIVKGREACLLVLRIVQKTFYDDSSLSVTSSLRAALRAANKALYQYNLNASSNKKAYVGITCAVLKGNDVFLAQVLPSQAYVLTEGTLRALPIHPSWNPAHVSVAPFMKTGALGSSLFVEPELYRCPLRSHDGFLLCSSAIAPMLEQATVEQILHQPDGTEAMDTLSALCEQNSLANVHAYMARVTLKPHKSQINPTTHPTTRGPWATIAHTLHGWITLRPGAHAPQQHEARTGKRTPKSRQTTTNTTDDLTHDYTLTHMPYQPDIPASPIPMPQDLDIGETLAERLEQVRQQRSSQQATSTDAPSSQLGEYHEETLPTSQSARDISTLPSQATPAPYRPQRQARPWIDMTWRERVLFPFEYTTTMILALLKRPARSLAHVWQDKQRPTAQERDKPPFPWFQLLALVLFVALLVLYGTNLARQSAEQQNLEYLEQARQYLEDMHRAPDHATSLQKLQSAEQALEQVRSSPLVTDTNPVLWLPFQELESEYERGLGAIQRLTYFDAPVVLAEHPVPNGQFVTVVVPELTTTVSDTFLIEEMQYIYALDSSNTSARLYRIPRDGGVPEPYLSPDDTIQNVLVGNLRTISWRIDSVVAIDQTANTFGYYFRAEGIWNYIRLGGSEVWAPMGRLDLETYEGNLYIWGAEPSEVIKFTSGRYGDIPQLWLDAVSAENRDLDAAIDMEIDGKIYLLMPEGNILVFHLGTFEREIVTEPLSPPLAAVTRMCITGGSEEGWIFLLDTLNERIIQIDKMTGSVVQQMKIRPSSSLRLNQLIDVYVDDRHGRPVIYLINGNQIIRADVPVPPQTFEQFQQSE